ncbi:MAG: multicopper oxidase domain-containing protein [Chloroflexi bacterium]|nr:multicopper oxidase domain-containing protein [Chloroflexota bacterium]
MITRRQFLKLGVAAGATTFFPWGRSRTGTAFAMPSFLAEPGKVSGATKPLTPWVDALPMLPLAKAGSTTDPLTGSPADYYEMEAKQSSTWQFHRDLPPAPTWGYWQGSTGPGYLGPTIVAAKNKPVVLKMVNNLPVDPLYKNAYDNTIGMPMAANHYPNISRICVHLHGGFVAPQCDGHPESWYGPLQNGKALHGDDYRSLPGAPENGYVYSFSNRQPAGLLWYHDHSMYQTRLNPFSGLAAGYAIIDGDDTVVPGAGGLNIPKLPYDIALVLQDRTFNDDGSMFYPTASGVEDPGYPHPVWQPEYFGDTPIVNGKAYPVLDVEPRRYRLRFLNGSQGRFFRLALGLPMWIIGTEGGLLPAPVYADNFLMAPAERYDVIVDFAPFAGGVIPLVNGAPAPYPFGDMAVIPNIMQFRVKLALQGKDTTLPPEELKLPEFKPLLPVPKNAKERDIVLGERMMGENPTAAIINDLWFEEKGDDTPKLNDTEIWNWVNLTGDAHPMHTHLFMFQVIERVPFDVEKYTGDWDAWVAAGRKPSARPKPLEYATGSAIPAADDEIGMKDTVKAYPGYITRIVGKFDVPPGSAKSGHEGPEGYEYVYHCHILEHEDNDMMRPFTVVT